MTLLNIAMAMMSPPFGLCLFVMKGVVKEKATMTEIYLGAMPYLGMNLIVMGLMLAFPAIVLWLPSWMS
jgi:TRAP-type mannitol/chloroaromatic compound transport system permease large subunit